MIKYFIKIVFAILKSQKFVLYNVYRCNKSNIKYNKKIVKKNKQN